MELNCVFVYRFVARIKFSMNCAHTSSPESLSHAYSINATKAMSIRLFGCFITTLFCTFGFAKIQLFHRMEDLFV